MLRDRPDLHLDLHQVLRAHLARDIFVCLLVSRLCEYHSLESTSGNWDLQQVGLEQTMAENLVVIALDHHHIVVAAVGYTRIRMAVAHCCRRLDNAT